MFTNDSGRAWLDTVVYSHVVARICNKILFCVIQTPDQLRGNALRGGGKDTTQARQHNKLNWDLEFSFDDDVSGGLHSIGGCYALLLRFGGF